MRFKTWLKESFFDKDGNWAGNDGASGILPIANDTKRICLALRSKHVHSKVNGQNVQTECWGTLGGAIQNDMSPLQSAKMEVEEETGFSGPYLNIFPAYVFSSGSFKYYNFIGLTAKEFAFSPASQHSWETLKIEWVEYNKLNQSGYNGYPFHDGLIALLRNSNNILQDIILPQANPKGYSNTLQVPSQEFLPSKQYPTT